MPYDKAPKTPFQQFIRLTKEGNIHNHFNKHIDMTTIRLLLKIESVSPFFSTGMLASPEDPKSNSTNDVLYDHHPLNLNKDDYQRVCMIPKKKVHHLQPIDHFFFHFSFLFLPFVFVSWVALNLSQHFFFLY